MRLRYRCFLVNFCEIFKSICEWLLLQFESFSSVFSSLNLKLQFNLSNILLIMKRTCNKYASSMVKTVLADDINYYGLSFYKTWGALKNARYITIFTMYLYLVNVVTLSVSSEFYHRLTKQFDSFLVFLLSQ